MERRTTMHLTPSEVKRAIRHYVEDMLKAGQVHKVYYRNQAGITVRMMPEDKMRCPDCGGSGYQNSTVNEFVVFRCSRCNGRGYTDKET